METQITRRMVVLLTSRSMEAGKDKLVVTENIDI